MSLPSPVRVPIAESPHSPQAPPTYTSSSVLANGDPSPSSRQQPPLLSKCSLEFACAAIPLTCVCFYGAHNTIRASYDSYDTYKNILEKPDSILKRLSHGFIRGYDAQTDSQWLSYTHFTPLFVCLFAGLALGSRILRGCQRRRQTHALASHPRRGFSLNDLLGRWWSLPLLHVVVGLVFAAILHGPHVVFLIATALVNYGVFRFLQGHVPYWAFAATMWATHIAFLYIAEVCDGFENVYWVQYWLPSSTSAVRRVLPPSMHNVKPLWGTMMRWQQLLRMVTLRMIAFNYDLWESTHVQRQARQRALQKHRSTCLECANLRVQNGVPAPNPEAGSITTTHNTCRSSSTRSSEGRKTRVTTPLNVNDVTLIRPDNMDNGDVDDDDKSKSHTFSDEVNGAACDESFYCYKFRTEYPRELQDYNLMYYLAFIFFAPLYLAGPMMSYNAFVSYLHHPTKGMPLKAMVRYVARIARVFGTAYLLLHFMYVQVMCSDLDHFRRLPTHTQALAMYWYLSYLWLKFAFLWRTSRLYAIWSGIEPPEDMRRCFSDTFTIQDFWRDWHASFNLWIVRYMYIPLGGRARIMYSLWPIFFFIAIWHDQRLHLLQWAVLIVISFVTELGSRALAARYLVRPVQQAINDANSGGGGSGRSSRPRWARRIAAVVLRWSPSKRQRAWRLVRGIAGATTILTLITINLIGFLVQFAPSKTQETSSPFDHIVPDGKLSETDHTIVDILFTPAHAVFALCVVLVMMNVGIHNVFYRDQRAELEAQERCALREAGQLSA